AAVVAPAEPNGIRHEEFRFMHLQQDVFPVSHLGWSSFFESQQRELGARRDQVIPARVVLASGERLHVLGPHGVQQAVLDRRLGGVNGPVVGDWVGLRADAPSEPRPVVHLFARTSALRRRRIRDGRRAQPRVLVANVDTVLIVCAFDAPVDVGAIARSAATVREGGANPVLVLNKADLCTDPEPLFHAVRAVAGSAQMIIASATTGGGIDSIRALTRRGETLALVGAPGAGKSALIHRLMGSDSQRHPAVSGPDDRGRATSHRELFILANGAILIDTPDLHELAL
ncbi:MAG TPA: GTPase RsgA, partial [Polyangiaceae bacterium]|nr:GTPase RsgA [Polyangiaceae bacterium]